MMYALLSKLVEIAASFGTRFLDSHTVSADAEIAGDFVRLIVALQDICLRGERILVAAEHVISGMANTVDEVKFEELIGTQRQAMGELAAQLGDLKALLATIDVQLSLDLTLLLDMKSGILTRWQQQVDQSHFSTTTIFFLPGAELDHALQIGRAQAAAYREDFVLTVANHLRDTRSREVRDIRAASESSRQQIREEIIIARADLRRARDLCSQLRAAAENALGAKAFAKLRRKLRAKPPAPSRT